MTVYGYARSSSQNSIEGQVNQLKEAGAKEIIKDIRTEEGNDREALSSLLEKLKAGDTIIIVGLDRISRNMEVTNEFTNELEKKGIELSVLQGTV